MRLLLDTHTFLWFIAGDSRLSMKAKGLIEDTSNDRLISMASIWEMAIKFSQGKLNITQPFHQFVLHQFAINRIEVLDIELRHVMEVSQLSHHHRDPFDRLIIAQSIVDNVAVVGADVAFDNYPINRLW